MYKLHLIRKYLLKRRIAWVALVAVTLCTAMVLVVFSVMDGWLETFENSFHASTGDVVITARNGLLGFPYYAQIIDRLPRDVPDVVAAVPMIENYGLIDIRGGGIDMVHVVGYPPDIGRVSAWPTLLHRQGAAVAAGAAPSFDLLPNVPYEDEFPKGSNAAKLARDRPGMIVTGPVVGITHGRPGVAARVRRSMVSAPVTLTVLPVVPGESFDKKAAQTVGFWIVDDVKSQVYALDAQNVYVAFDELQRDLRMEATADEPARCSQVLVKVRPGADLRAVAAAVERSARAATDAAGGIPGFDEFDVKTWEEQQGPFIRAVQSEVVMTTVLFSVISMVAVLLIFCIFYMIVVEKTKDIGIIKSVGATGGGIMVLFLAYGLAIGVVGSALGVGLAFGIVRNINELHAWLGREMGVQIWSPETYQFDSIPSKMKMSTVVWTVGVALVSAVLGALLPAVRAAGMNPVDSLRYE